MDNRPDPKLVASLLEYDPATGWLTWRERRAESFRSQKEGEAKRWNGRYAGRPAFTAKMGGGYRCGAINKLMLQAHVVAWCLHYGSWPEDQIDHINGDPLDNRIANLRSASAHENSRNKKTPKNNTSGVIGVSYCNRDRVWIAHIAGKRLSGHKQKADAVSARKAAEKKLGFHPNHGRTGQ